MIIEIAPMEESSFIGAKNIDPRLLSVSHRERFFPRVLLNLVSRRIGTREHRRGTSPVERVGATSDVATAPIGRARQDIAAGFSLEKRRVERNIKRGAPEREREVEYRFSVALINKRMRLAPVLRLHRGYPRSTVLPRRILHAFYASKFHPSPPPLSPSPSFP